MTKLYLHSFKTKLGTVHTATSENGLALIALPGEPRRDFHGMIRKHFPGCEICYGGEVNRKAQKQIVAYLDGKLKEFDLPLDIIGTTFQKKTLRRVAGIPYGKTITYGEIARAIDHPRACRAVGRANAGNNLPIVIPCHRVVAASSLGGYRGGLTLKKRLLKLEGII